MTERKQKTCPTCGEVFDIPSTRPNQKYCCMDCSVQGRQAAKLDQSGVRVEAFIDSLPDLEILDVLEGRVSAGAGNNRITARGAMAHNRPGVRFIVLAVEDRAED